MNTQTESTIRNPKSAIGFSLTELLVVIGVIVILFTVAVPNVRKLTGSGDTAAAVNTFSAAVAAARTRAGLYPAFEHGSYSGVAIIVDTAGQLRLTTNAERFPSEYWYNANQYVRDDKSTGPTDRILETPVPQPASSPRHDVNGYVDIPGRDYTKLPANTGLLGIVRGQDSSNNPTLKLLHPPFAVRFNAEGTFISAVGVNVSASTSSTVTAQQARRVVLYDGNYDGLFTITVSNPGSNGSNRKNSYGTGDENYNVNQWDPESSQFNQVVGFSNVQHSSGRIYLPFESIESVAGILAYSKADMPDNLALTDGGEEEDFGSGTVGQWLMDNGTIIFINRYTGALNKQE